MLLNPAKLHVIGVLMKDYYDIEGIEKLKKIISKHPDFRFFISPQYRDEPRYDIYIMVNEPENMLNWILYNDDLMEYIDRVDISEI